MSDTKSQYKFYRGTRFISVEPIAPNMVVCGFKGIHILMGDGSKMEVLCSDDDYVIRMKRTHDMACAEELLATILNRGHETIKAAIKGWEATKDNVLLYRGRHKRLITRLYSINLFGATLGLLAVGASNRKVPTEKTISNIGIGLAAVGVINLSLIMATGLKYGDLY